MTDWSDEAKIQLEETARLLSGKPAEAIRAALGEIERLGQQYSDVFTMEPCPKCGLGPTRGCYGCDLQAAEAAHREAAAQWQDESRLRRAAEAKLEVATREYGVAADERDALKAKLAEAQSRIALWERALPNTAEHVAEVERLREALDEARAEVDGLREREVDVARALDLLGRNRVDLPALARDIRFRAVEAEARIAALIEVGDHLSTLGRSPARCLAWDRAKEGAK